MHRCPVIVLSLLLVSCHEVAATPLSPGDDKQVADVLVAAPPTGSDQQVSYIAHEETIAAPAQEPPEVRLPDKLVVGKFEDVPIAGDRALRVAHARENLTRAIVYLHGMCGNSQGADNFADLLTAYGTVIVVIDLSR